MKVYQGRIASKVEVRSVNTEVGISNGGARHVKRIDNLLEIRGRAIGGNLIGENGEECDGERREKRTAYLTKGTNKSHD